MWWASRDFTRRWYSVQLSLPFRRVERQMTWWTETLVATLHWGCGWGDTLRDLPWGLASVLFRHSSFGGIMRIFWGRAVSPAWSRTANVSLSEYQGCYYCNTKGIAILLVILFWVLPPYCQYFVNLVLIAVLQNVFAQFILQYKWQYFFENRPIFQIK